MSLVLDVRVYGLPLAQGRPRTRIANFGGAPRAVVYDPAASRDWKQTVAAQVLDHRPEAPVEGPLAMSLAFLFPRPKSLPKRVRHHTTRPDADNCAKAVKDALRGIVYRDDAQIVDLHVTKGYDPAPGVIIRVRRIVDQPERADVAHALTPAATPEGRRDPGSTGGRDG